VKDGAAPGDVFIVHRVTFVTDITDFNAIDMAAIIEQSLGRTPPSQGTAT
jgi:hypothetical protein